MVSFTNLYILEILSWTKIDKIHRRAEISYVIGAKDYWGKGVATQAIAQVIMLAKKANTNLIKT